MLDHPTKRKVFLRHEIKEICFILQTIIHKYISEMAGESKNDKYIICHKCKCKCINDEEHISTDFGYTRSEERYKTCKKCREHRKQ